MPTLEKATYKEICKMRRDNYQRGNFSIMTDGTTVWLSQQASGEQPTQQFEISRRMFNYLLNQYQKDQKFIRG